jgi:hypothetical protein
VPHSEFCVHAHDAPLLQLVALCTRLHPPLAHEYPATPTESTWQSSLSAVPDPVQVPVPAPEHWLLALTHLPLEHCESSVQRQ